GVRSEGPGRTHHPDRLRRAPGRRRHPHGGHHGRVHRRAGRGEQVVGGRPACKLADHRAGGGGVRGYRPGPAPARSRIHRGRELRYGHERGHDRRRALCGSAGHGRRRRVHPRRNGRAAAVGGKGHCRAGGAAGKSVGCLAPSPSGGGWGAGGAATISPSSMISKIVLASNNPGKLAELRAMFAPLGIELIRQSDLGISEAEEPHRTFVENALAKARHAARASGLPALADDAGLCVEAFGGLPGVDTAFYATRFGYEKGDANNVKALLEQLKDQPNRRAALVSTLVALRTPEDPEPLIAVGRAAGEIARAPVGSNGFGFDPVMYIPEFGKTFAQLPVEVKNANSHRGKAARQMLELIQERWL